MKDGNSILKGYELAQDHYQKYDLSTEQAIRLLSQISISLPCWQGDDVGGFEYSQGSEGSIQATGNYQGKARNPGELRSDLLKAISLIPGNHRVNLHSIYGNFNNKKIERTEFSNEHYLDWISWAKQSNIKLDFNATCFNHPKAASGFTLSDFSDEIRKYWIAHVKKCREISAFIGQQIGSTCVHNLWIPDGSKDISVLTNKHRTLLKDSLDEIYSVEYNPMYLKDSLEPKLFGIGSESTVIGSYDFYYGYALSHKKMLCIDTGHFHPTESIADKISSILLYFDELLLHLSRGVRWDSDHVVILDDALLNLASEIVRSVALNKIHFSLDYFDASINRVGAWVIGARAVMKALLYAILEPHDTLKLYEENKNYFARLALLEEMKNMPFGAVWDYFCIQNNIPTGQSWIKEITDYEQNTLLKRQ